MLSILYDEYLKWGCPNCGCDAIKGSCVSGGGLTSGTCRHCEGWGSNPRHLFPCSLVGQNT